MGLRPFGLWRASAAPPSLALALAVALALSSCSNPTYFPDAVGTTWTYDVRNGFGATFVQDAKISRRLTVAGTDGFELSGALGPTRLAWKKGVLWAERFANLACQPPLPLLRLDKEPMSWKGQLETAKGIVPASGRLTHQPDKIKIGSRSFEALKSELQLSTRAGTTTLTSWFAPNVGIVRQEQRTGGSLDTRVEWVAGPSSK